MRNSITELNENVKKIGQTLVKKFTEDEVEAEEEPVRVKQKPIPKYPQQNEEDDDQEDAEIESDDDETDEDTSDEEPEEEPEDDEEYVPPKKYPKLPVKKNPKEKW